jgi:cytochrome P450
MKAFQDDAAQTLLVHADYCRQHNLPGVEMKAGIIGSFQLLVDPELVEQVLTDKSSTSRPTTTSNNNNNNNNNNSNNLYREGIFYKSALDRRGVGLLTGRGSLLTDGPDHTRKRRLVVPSLNDKSNLQTFLEIMESVSLEYAQDFTQQIITTAKANSTTGSSNALKVNIGESMSAIAMKIVGLALFSQDVVDGAIYQDISTCLEHVIYVTRHPLTLPKWIPTRRNRRFRRALQRLDDLVYSFIAAGQAQAEAEAERQHSDTTSTKRSKKNLLNMLLAARYEAKENDNDTSKLKLSDKELRDEIMTLFLAGHETTAITLCWTLWFLSDPQHAHWQDRIAQEYQAAVGDNIDTTASDIIKTGYTPALVEDATALETTRAVLCEALRLRTPTYAVDREVQQDVDVTINNGTQTIHWKKKDLLLISPLVMHMDPSVFPNPETFDPTRFILNRFDDDKTARAPGQDLWEGPFSRREYLPFGAGRKRCIGYKFAQWELLVILGTLLSQFRVSRPKGVTSVAWEAGVTLRPHRDLELLFEPRE